MEAALAQQKRRNAELEAAQTELAASLAAEETKRALLETAMERKAEVRFPVVGPVRRLQPDLTRRHGSLGTSDRS